MSNGDPRSLAKQKQNKFKSNHSNDSDVFQPARIRSNIRLGNAHHRKLLSNRYHILFHFNILFWLIFTIGVKGIIMAK